jgi:hypothetical protein
MSGQVLAKAGLNVHADLSAGTLMAGDMFAVDQWIFDAESMIVDATKIDFITEWSNMISGTKLLLGRIAAADAAKQCVMYDPNSYPGGRSEAEMKVNILHDEVTRGLALIKESEYKDFIKTER